MGDSDLIVSGGGSIVVASDALLARIELLARLVIRIGYLRTRLASAAGDVTTAEVVCAGAGTNAAQVSLQRADEELARAGRQCETLRAALVTALEGYGAAERLSTDASRAISAQVGWSIGALSPVLVVGAAAALPSIVTGVAIGALLSGHPGRVAGAAVQLFPTSELVTGPAAVALIRSTVMSADDTLGGALHLPGPVITAPIDGGVGVGGLSSSAALAVLLGRAVGVMGDVPVVVRPTGTTVVSPATTVRDRAARIPQPGDRPDGAQIRIDRYSRPGAADRFEVYIAGTVDGGLGTGTEPWDMGSNVTALAELPASSYRAVRDAMEQAGITADSEVLLSGYSQGGLVASMIVASGQYNVRGLVTFGSPSGQLKLPADVPVLTVRHSDDLVPALGGTDVNTHPLVVQRELFADAPVPHDAAVPAHKLARYEQTAALIDGAQSSRVRDAVAATLDPGASGEWVETTAYRAQRVSDAAASGGAGATSGGR